ncbi:hypothetical protein BGZ83_011551 [Gryganskiella cystojenkinii]|nr:hypothetical protein BGZ83_011551 [Gryganskiella cystojenkinii]
MIMKETTTSREILEILACCPRLDQLTVNHELNVSSSGDNAQHGVSGGGRGIGEAVAIDEDQWLDQFSRLWSRLRHVSLNGQYVPEQMMEEFTMDNSWLHRFDHMSFSGSSRIQELHLCHFDEAVYPSQLWIIKQSPGLKYLTWTNQWSHLEEDVTRLRPMRDLAELIHPHHRPPGFFEQLETLALPCMDFINEDFSRLMASLVGPLSAGWSAADQENTIMTGTKP